MGEKLNYTLKLKGTYLNFAIKKNKTVRLSFNFSYEERINAIKAIALVGQDIKITAKLLQNPPVILGQFLFYSLKLDRDGQTTLVLDSEIDSVDVKNINSIIDDENLLKLKFDSLIELEGEQDE